MAGTAWSNVDDVPASREAMSPSSRLAACAGNTPIRPQVPMPCILRRKMSALMPALVPNIRTRSDAFAVIVPVRLEAVEAYWRRSLLVRTEHLKPERHCRKGRFSFSTGLTTSLHLETGRFRPQADPPAPFEDSPGLRQTPQGKTLTTSLPL